MSVLPAVLAVVGMGMKFAGTIQEGKAQQAAYDYNASVARQQASMAEESGKLEAYRMRKASASFSAKQRALFSKAGVQYLGSPLEVMFADAADMELDAILTEYNTSIQMSAFMSESEYNSFLGRQARRSSQTRAWGSLLTSAGTFALAGGFGSSLASGIGNLF